MLRNWLPRVLFWVVFPVVMEILRRTVPPRFRATEHRYDEAQVPEPLPTGVVGGAMWTIGIGLALTFFVLRDANHWWASLDGSSILTQYAPISIWCFFPGFAALAIPWPLTVWYLRKVGRWEEADTVEDDSDARGGANSYTIMKWLSLGLVAPIGVFTVLAIPIHLSITDSAVKVGHYASLRSEIFPFNQARRATVIDGYKLRDGTLQPAKDLIIDFADGRRLKGNQVGDGGTSIPDDLMQLLIAKTGLTPGHAETADDIPALPRPKTP